MALNIDLISDAGIILELDASPYGINLNGGMGQPDLSHQFVPQWQRGYRPLVSQNTGNRTAQFSIQVHGTSHDDWANNYRQLAHVLALANEYSISGGRTGAAAYVSIQLSGATAPTIYDVVAATVPPITLFTPAMNLTVPYALAVPVELQLKPWGHRQALTRATATIKAFGGKTSGVDPNSQVLTITPSSAMTRESPAAFYSRHGLFSGTGEAAASGAGQLIIGRRSRGGVLNFHPWFQAEPGSATHYTATTGAVTGMAFDTSANTSYQGGARLVVRYPTAAIGGTGPNQGNIVTWTLTAPENYRGRYRVFVYADNAGSTIWHSAYITAGGIDLASQAPWVGWRDMGLLDIPASPAGLDYPMGTFSFSLYGKFSSAAACATYVAAFDAAVLVPVDEQYIHIPGGTSRSMTLIDGLDARLSFSRLNSSYEFAAVTVNASNSLAPYGPIQPARPTKWVVLAGNQTSNDGFPYQTSDDFGLRLDYHTMTDGLL